MKDHKRTEKISSTTEDYDDENNPIESIIDRLRLPDKEGSRLLYR